MVKRKISVTLEDEVVKLVEDYRRRQDKIPSFSGTINILIKRAAKERGENT